MKKLMSLVLVAVFAMVAIGAAMVDTAKAGPLPNNAPAAAQKHHKKWRKHHRHTVHKKWKKHHKNHHNH